MFKYVTCFLFCRSSQLRNFGLLKRLWTFEVLEFLKTLGGFFGVGLYFILRLLPWDLGTRNGKLLHKVTYLFVKLTWNELCWFNCQLNLESPRKSLSEELLRSDLVYGCVCGGLSWLLIDVGRQSPLWEAPFPRQKILNCVNKKNQAEQQASNMHVFISLFPWLWTW